MKFGLYNICVWYYLKNRVQNINKRHTIGIVRQRRKSKCSNHKNPTNQKNQRFRQFLDSLHLGFGINEVLMTNNR